MNTNAPKTHKVRKGVAAVVMNVILIIFSLSCIFPIVWMVYSSLKEKRVFNADIMGLPKNPTLINYIKILSNKDYHLGESMLNRIQNNRTTRSKHRIKTIYNRTQLKKNIQRNKQKK